MNKKERQIMRNLMRLIHHRNSTSEVFDEMEDKFGEDWLEFRDVMW